MITETKNYLPYIDGLRGISILAVLCFHLFPKIFPNGYAGVDVFFVISGYLITGSINDEQDNDKFKLKTFFARRIRRIFPALFLVIITILLIGIAALPYSDLLNLGRHSIAGSFFGSNILLWLESGYFDSESKLKPFLHLWSLGVEEQFYILWPILLMFFTASKRKFFFSSIIVFSVLAYVYTYFQNPSTAFYLLPFRVWQLGLGAYLTTVPNRNESSFGTLALAALLVSLFCPAEFPQIYIVLISTVASSGLILFSGSDLIKKFFSFPIFMLLGKISYPLYLWHWPIVSLLYLKNISLTPLNALLVFIVSIVLAWITFNFIEKPVKKKFSLGVKSDENKLFLYGVSFLLLPLLITYISKNSSSEIRELARYKHFRPPIYKSGKCFLDAYQNQVDFDPSCIEIDKPKKIFIWGDSISAQFYIPLRERLSAETYGLTTMSASLCPPLVNFDRKERPNCLSVNRFYFSLIEKHRPDTLILLSNWYYYGDDKLNQRLSETIRLSKEAGVKNVILVGQLPFWKNPLFEIFGTELENKKISEIPEFNSEHLMPMISNVDIHMQNVAEVSGAEFVPILSKVCRNGECPATFNGRKAENLSSFDHIHPTPVAAGIYTGLILPYIEDINSGSTND